MDGSLLDSSVREISQARLLEWVAISISKEISDPGIKPESPTLQADSYWATRETWPRGVLIK